MRRPIAAPRRSGLRVTRLRRSASIPRCSASIRNCSFARNRALIDGNKRTVFLAAALMLERNGVIPAALPDQREATMIAVAVGDMDVPEIAEHFRKWSE